MSHLTPAQAALLKAEILQPKYTGMTDEQIALAINSATWSVPNAIRTADARTQLMFVPNGDWGKTANVSNGVTNTNATAKEHATRVYELFSWAEPFDATSDNNWNALMTSVNYLIQNGGYMSAGGKTALEALRVHPEPYWTKFLYRELDWADVAEARGT